MKNNFFTEFLTQLENIKPKLLEMLENRGIEVHRKDGNEYQVSWKKRFEIEYSEIMTSFESLLNQYKNFQVKSGLEIFDLLSISKEREFKSILNLLRKDIWFDNDVHSKFEMKNNQFHRHFRGHIQEEIFITGVTIENAKNAMIDQCRKELTDSFLAKFEHVKHYLLTESKKLSEKVNEISKSEEKYSDFYNYGLSIISVEPTIAMVLLGVSIECLLKVKYLEPIYRTKTLGQLFSILKRKKLFLNQVDLLAEINDSYIIAKHDIETEIPEKDVRLLYEKSTNFF